MKKDWINPEVNILGLENTKEECTEKDDKGLLLHTCNHCGRLFGSHKAEKEHEKNCYKNPVHQPITPDLPNGEFEVPMS